MMVWAHERRREMRHLAAKALLTGLGIGIIIGLALGNSW